MAVLSRVLFTTFGVGASAFAPSGGLRGQAERRQAAGQEQQQQPQAPLGGAAPLAAVGVAAALAAGARSRGAAKKAKVVVRAADLAKAEKRPLGDQGGDKPWCESKGMTTTDKWQGDPTAYGAEGSDWGRAPSRASDGTVGGSSWASWTTNPGEVGICFPITDKWDPLNLSSTPMKMARYTDVEIKHGRVAMIACMGYFIPEIFRFPGCEDIDHGLAALNSLPFEGWLQLVALIGAHELLLKPGTRPGAINGMDYGFGTEVFDGNPEFEKARRQTVERNNGRLAMIAIMGLMIQDYTFGMTPIQMINKGGFYGPPVDFIVKDIGICMGYTYCAQKERTSRTIMRSGYSECYKPFQNGRYPPAPGEEWDDDWGFPDPDVEPEMSPSMPFLTMPKHLKGWVGGEKGFDPLGVTDALPVYWVREAELKHGRVCMLATLGWITTDLGVRFPGDIYQVSTIEAHNKLVDEGQMQPFLGAIGVAELYGLYLIIEGWGGEIDRSAGDFFLGKNFLPKDLEGEKDMKLKEIENGRLAMLAFGGIATVSVMTGKTWPFFD